MSGMANVQVYSIETCPYCVAARRLLDQLGIDYELTDLSDHPDRWAVTAEILPGHTTVPLVLIDGEPVGGYTELEALHRAGSLEARIFGG